MWDEKNKSKDSFDIAAFLLWKESNDLKDEASHHVHNIEKTKDTTLHLKACPVLT